MREPAAGQGQAAPPRMRRGARPAAGARASQVPLVVALVLAGLAGARAEPTTATANETQPGQQQAAIGDLVAIGAVGLLGETAPRQGPGEPGAGRLVDRIATNLEPSAGHQEERANDDKLAYIIEFMRANKLTKFCDLLTGGAPEVRRVRHQVNALRQFTLFVPTNEALLLLASNQWDHIRRRPQDTADFLMAHATSELVVPRLEGAAGRAQLEQANRWSSGRPVERPLGSTSLVYSLGGGALRVATVPVWPAGRAQANATGAGASTRLELIVNGANVLAGHSHALQEPNNSSATYAVVHLVDRALYPAPSLSVADRLRQLAPRMAKYVELARDEQLDGRLRSARHLTTAFVPNDDAFRATPAKLLDQLATNRTFLVRFLRAHLVDGIYFGGQLAAGAGPAPGGQQHQAPAPARQLDSLAAGLELELETKPLQARNLILVNSVPVLESDLMATNGVVHVISRPIFERSHLEACHCEVDDTRVATSGQVAAPLSAANWTTGSVVGQQAEVGEQESGKPMGTPGTNEPFNWFRELGAPSATNELEREESRADERAQVAPGGAQGSPAASLPRASEQRARSQRSGGSLVARNNRDFYRPLAAPANLELQSAAAGEPAAGGAEGAAPPPLGQPLILSQGAPAGGQPAPVPGANLSAVSQHEQPVAQSRRPAAAPADWPRAQLDEQLFEVERYKVVLNATSRQRLREQQRANLTGAPRPAANANQFVYDLPLATQNALELVRPTESSVVLATRLDAARHQYAAAAAANQTAHQDRVAPAASTNQQQRLLKFQADDALHAPLPGARLHKSARAPGGGANGAGPTSAGAADTPALPANWGRQQQLLGKTLAPGAGPFSGCAFYDAECKRLVARLVHLPAHASAGLKAFRPAAGNQTTQLTFAPQTTPAPPADQHLDSTFGETTERPVDRLLQTTTRMPLAHLSKATGAQFAAGSNGFFVDRHLVVPARVSPLNQPLPPWSDETPGRPPSNWRAHDLNDIARIRLASGKLGQASGEQATGAGAGGPPMGGGHQTTGAHVRTQTMAQILFVPVKMVQDAAALSFHQRTPAANNRTGASQPIYFGGQMSHAGSGVTFSTNMQYHTPTVRPRQASRLTNFTTLDMLPADEQPAEPEPGAGPMLNQQSQRHQRIKQAPLAPASFKKSPARLINESLGAHLDPDGIKQARKIVRLQVAAPHKQHNMLASSANEFDAGGDISITSARLVSPDSAGASVRNVNNATFGGGLATQASDQAPDVSSNFVRSVASQLEGQAAADFFQNRTIAEIMDDSGLRIDGQQVTFNRLKDCLRQADLLSLITQVGNSLTIFMPTDLAFQRLVQQQAIAQQRERGSRSSASGRLVDPQRHQHLVPLVARVDRTGEPTRLADLLGASALEPVPLASGLASRLTLDCSSPQVRQLLLDHLSGQLITPRQLLTDTSLSSLSGRRLLVSSVPSKKIVVVDGQPVIAATRAKNGMVYVINKFLNLTHQVPNVVDLIEAQPNLTTFLSYLTFSSLADRLKRETGPITVLAPTNDAFEQLSSAARQLINSDPSALADILRGHVVDGAQFGKLISMRNKLKTMNSDQSIEARVIKPNIYQLDNQLTSIRLIGTAGNGVVNAIDRLIVPPWLRVSLAGRPGQQGSARDSAGVGGTEVEGSANQLVRQPLNLPIISNQPLTFEQPDARLAPSNSFLLAGSGTSPSADNNLANGNSLLDSFDVPSSSVSMGGANGAGDITGRPLSPFLRVASNLTGSPLPAGGRLSSAPLDLNNNILVQSNITKNMQLIDKLAGLMKAKKFVKYLLRSRLSESLKPDMNYVILVPTDQAIDKLPKQIIDMLDRDTERLTDLVNYHVLDTTFEYINTIPDGQTLNTLNEKDILFNWHRNNTILTASGAVVLGGIQEENIALLIVDRVLYPTPGDLLSIISKSPILSNFTSLVRNAGLERQLALPGPYTLFAPSDIAFNQLEKRDLDFLQRNPETARRFLLRHLSQPAIFTSSIALSNTTEATSPAGIGSSSSTSLSRQHLVPSLTISNSLGEDLILRQRNDYFSVNDVNFSYADVAATNGVMHVIDGLL